MVKIILSLDSIPKPDDAADALAVAMPCPLQRDGQRAQDQTVLDPTSKMALLCSMQEDCCCYLSLQEGEACVTNL